MAVSYFRRLRDHIRRHRVMIGFAAIFTNAGLAIHWVTAIIDWVSRRDTLNAHSSALLAFAGALRTLPEWTPEAFYALAVLLIGSSVLYRDAIRSGPALPTGAMQPWAYDECTPPSFRETSAPIHDAMRESFRKYSKHPIVEPELISDAGARSVRLFVVNIGDEPAVDVTIAPIGEDSISFVPIRVLRPSDSKTEVQAFFYDANAQSFMSPFAKGLLVAKMSYKAGWTSGIDGKIKFANYVPACITYGDSLGRLYHTHDYVFADVSHHQVVIRRKLDSEAIRGASPAHDPHCPYCRPGNHHPERRAPP
jgi:hypothetical protein